LLAELRASGHEFDVERSQQVIEDLDTRQTPGGKRAKRKPGADVA
jgi:hypothetical protein